MKKLVFVMGLPKSGKSVLVNTLVQNPDIEFIEQDLYSKFADIYYDKTTKRNTDQKIEACIALFDQFLSQEEKTFVFKDRRWSRFIVELDYIFGNDIRFVACFRSFTEILAAFERERLSNPFNYISDETSTLPKRNALLANIDGLIGSPFNQIYDSVTQGRIDKITFIDYNTLCSAPLYVLKKVYTDIDHDFFKHDINDIKQDFISAIEYIGVREQEVYSNHNYWESLQ